MYVTKKVNLANLRLIEEYIISPTTPPPPQRQTHRASANRALAHGSQPMGPQPKELQPNNISLYESLGIEFFEALFLIIMNLDLEFICFFFHFLCHKES